eukprot:2453140-Pyramimonas_sp.AAC.2
MAGAGGEQLAGDRKRVRGGVRGIRVRVLRALQPARGDRRAQRLHCLLHLRLHRQDGGAAPGECGAQWYSKHSTQWHSGTVVASVLHLRGPLLTASTVAQD